MTNTHGGKIFNRMFFLRLLSSYFTASSKSEIFLVSITSMRSEEGGRKKEPRRPRGPRKVEGVRGGRRTWTWISSRTPGRRIAEAAVGVLKVGPQRCVPPVHRWGPSLTPHKSSFTRVGTRRYTPLGVHVYTDASKVGEVPKPHSLGQAAAAYALVHATCVSSMHGVRVLTVLCI